MQESMAQYRSDRKKTGGTTAKKGMEEMTRVPLVIPVERKKEAKQVTLFDMDENEKLTPHETA